jgi:hypothetical protein
MRTDVQTNNIKILKWAFSKLKRKNGIRLGPDILQKSHQKLFENCSFIDSNYNGKYLVIEMI